MYKDFKIGKLTVMYEVEKIKLPSGQTNRAFMCLCECGNTKIVRLLHLKRGRTLSCGCLSHKRDNRGNTRLCKIWRAMKYRCTENYYENHLYFNKGIFVCKEWINDYFEFERWALNNGYNNNLQIDRINNSKGYYPDNCRWVTSKINCNNRDVTLFVDYDGKKESLKLLLSRLNISNNYYSIYSRIKRGWDHKKAIDTPIRIGNYHS